MRGRSLALRAAALILCLAAAACRSDRSATSRPADGGPGPYYGVASWYGKPFHGRTTASGERFNMNQLTAAHPWLPFNTVVRVTNLKNQRSVDVRINDRGPFIKGRIIDLSRASARKIDMIVDGVVDVRVDVLTRGGA